MSPSAKEALKALDDIQSDIIGMVATNRNVDPSVVREWLERPVNAVSRHLSAVLLIALP